MKSLFLSGLALDGGLLARAVAKASAAHDGLWAQWLFFEPAGRVTILAALAAGTLLVAGLIWHETAE